MPTFSNSSITISIVSSEPGFEFSESGSSDWRRSHVTDEIFLRDFARSWNFWHRSLFWRSKLTFSIHFFKNEVQLNSGRLNVDCSEIQTLILTSFRWWVASKVQRFRFETAFHLCQHPANRRSPILLEIKLYILKIWILDNISSILVLDNLARVSREKL